MDILITTLCAQLHMRVALVAHLPNEKWSLASEQVDGAERLVLRWQVGAWNKMTIIFDVGAEPIHAVRSIYICEVGTGWVMGLSLHDKPPDGSMTVLWGTAQEEFAHGVMMNRFGGIYLPKVLMRVTAALRQNLYCVPPVV